MKTVHLLNINNLVLVYFFALFANAISASLPEYLLAPKPNDVDNASYLAYLCAELDKIGKSMYESNEAFCDLNKCLQALKFRILELPLYHTLTNSPN